MFLSVEYSGVGKIRALKSYKGFSVSEKDAEDKIFMSGDPVKDFQDAESYIAERMAVTGEHCGMSSSVDHFVSDCRGVFEWYTDVNGREVFDWAEKAQELAEKHKEERIKRGTAVRDFLMKLGVPEDTAWADTIEIFNNCSPTTFVALSKQLSQ